MTSTLSFFSGLRPRQKGGSGPPLPLNLVSRLALNCGSISGWQKYPRTKSAFCAAPAGTLVRRTGKGLHLLHPQIRSAPAAWSHAVSGSDTAPAAGMSGSSPCSPYRPSGACLTHGSRYSISTVCHWDKRRYLVPCRSQSRFFQTPPSIEAELSWAGHKTGCLALSILGGTDHSHTWNQPSPPGLG